MYLGTAAICGAMAMTIMGFIYQRNLIEIGYFIAVAATIMKFYSEKFKGSPAYTLVLVNDLLKLSFISVAVVIGFNIIVLVNRNHDAIEKLVPPEPVIMRDDRIDRVLELFNDMDITTLNWQEANRLATDLYIEIFGNDGQDAPLDMIILRTKNGLVLCRRRYNNDDVVPFGSVTCEVGERG